MITFSQNIVQILAFEKKILSYLEITLAKCIHFKLLRCICSVNLITFFKSSDWWIFFPKKLVLALYKSFFGNIQKFQKIANWKFNQTAN